MKIKNSGKLIKRIALAVKNKERIIILGDSDMDGVGATVILKETLELISPFYKKRGNIIVYFPDREKEGYGLNNKALANLSKFSPALLFLLDCGIGNAKEISKAQKSGLSVIVIDHHKILPAIPKCLIIDPQQKGGHDKYKILCTAGLIYEITKDLLYKAGVSYDVSRFLEIAALATLSDKVPLREENRNIVEQGEKCLKYTQRKGLKSLMNLTHFSGLGGTQEIESKLLKALGSAKIIKHKNEDYLLLESKNFSQSRLLAKRLIKEGEEKREAANNILKEIISKLTKEKQGEIIFEGKKNWNLISLGRVASQLVNIYNKPVFLFKLSPKESVASARLPSGYDGVKAMESCGDLFITYGGHAPACGFRAKNSNFAKIKSCLNKYFKNYGK